MNGPNKLECLSHGQPFQPGVFKHFSLLSLFTSYEEKEVL